MVPAVTPGQMKNHLLSALKDRSSKENTWDIRDRLKKSRVEGWWRTWIPHLEQRISRKALEGHQRLNPFSHSKAGAESLELFLVDWKGKTEVGVENLKEWLLERAFCGVSSFVGGLFGGRGTKLCVPSLWTMAGVACPAAPSPAFYEQICDLLLPTVKQKFILFVVSKVGFSWQLQGCWCQGDGKNPRHLS